MALSAPSAPPDRSGHAIDPIVQQRVHLSLFYKQYLAPANEAAWLTVAATHVHHVGGMDSGNAPSPFLACLVRLLELDPEPRIVQLLWTQPHFKYVSAIALMHLRMTAPAATAYRALFQGLRDYRKLRQYNAVPIVADGVMRSYSLSYIDVFADQLQHAPRVLGLLMPRLPPYRDLVLAGQLSEPEVSDDDKALLDAAPAAAPANSHDPAGELYESDSD